MITPQDEPFLRRALRLAMNGRGHVEPNPMVGCVLVKNGQIIGEGWHQKFGGPHAEPNALADCNARGNDPAGATAYVTLEPCCHQNKKTPPCAPRLIDGKVARVVIGCLDPNPAVNGDGVAMLQAAGIEVDLLPSSRGTGLRHVEDLKSRAGGPCHEDLDGSHFQQLIAPFIHSQSRNGLLAYVTAKWAESADGFVAGPGSERRHITNSVSDREVQRLRSRCDAIVVGIGTVLSDNPSLTVRGVPTLRTPTRLVLDRDLRTPLTCELVRSATKVPTAIQCSRPAWKDAAKRAPLEAAGVRVDFIYGEDEEAKSISKAETYTASPTHVLVEPGPTLARSILPWVARLWVFRSRSNIHTGLPAAQIPPHYVPTGTLSVADDTLTEFLNTQSRAFFAAVPSADFILTAESLSSVA